MADQFDSNTRSPYPDDEIDDPLAELARIIGYERPSEVTSKTEESPESSEFDLEAELMRELDVPLAPSADELENIEADEALDALLADANFDQEPEDDLPDAGRPDSDELSDTDRPDTDVLNVEESSGDGPELDDADFVSAEGRSSGALLKAIENEFPSEQNDDQASDEPGGDEEDLALVLDADEFVPESQIAEPELDDADAEKSFEPVQDVPEKVAASVAVDAQATDADSSLDDDVLADMVRYELPSGGPEANDTPAAPGEELLDGERDETTLDFEEYLSTELDVFGHEVAMDRNKDEIEDVGHAGEFDENAVADVEIALDALNDSALDDEVAVFDDAAEELLAAINNDVEYGGGTVAAGDPSNDPDNGWSLDNIEETTADELDDELGDMFGLPERVVDPLAAKNDAADHLELDLEQVLADSFDGSDDDWAEPVEVAAAGPQAEQVVETDDWLSARTAEQPARRDELADAFLGLVPDSDDADLKPEPASGQSTADSSFEGADAEPLEGDWLAGFETSEQVVEPAGSQSGDSDYYFDAELISESDETVEMVADIDVPELEQYDPQPLDPDYDTEIEREFAGIVERNEPNPDEGPAVGAAAGFGSAEGWSRSATTPRGYEVSDDYIALERELGVDRSTGASMTAGFDGDVRTREFDVSGGMAAGQDETGNGSRGPVLAIAVLGLALLAGVGAFGWSMLSGDETSADGGPRIIRADKDPVKVLPENPGGVTVPNQDKAVYDRVAGGTGASTGQPALVNSAEEPVDVVQRTLDPEILPLEGRSDFAGKSEDRLSADGSAPETAANGPTVPVVSPRKVRTMIVKPDGSIVAREVPEPETSTAGEGQQDLASADTQVETTAEPAQSPEPFVQPSAEAVTAVQDQPSAADDPAIEGTLAPVRIVKTQPIRPVANAPVPQERPGDQPVNVVGIVSQGGRVGAAPAASAVPATPAAPQPVAVASAPVAAAPAANPGGYYVQIASQPTVEGAQSSWRTLSNRYSSVLGGLSVDIQRADITGKGVYHRVRIPAGSKDQANALCSRYKAAGGSCFVSR